MTFALFKSSDTIYPAQRWAVSCAWKKLILKLKALVLLPKYYSCFQVCDVPTPWAWGGEGPTRAVFGKRKAKGKSVSN